MLAVAPAIDEPFSSHWLPEAAEEVSVTLPPVQKVVGPLAVTVGVDGMRFTVTEVCADAGEVQPLAVALTV